MAQHTTVRFVDDLDGSEAAGTVSFSLDGRAYEIDLSEENTDRFHAALAPFIGAARKTGGGRSRGRARRQPTDEYQPARPNREETRAIRVWAREHGHKINDRGRIPSAVLEAYKTAS